MTEGLAATPAVWRRSCLFGVLALLLPIAAASAAESLPGFVPGDTAPTVDGPVVRVPGGWMVPYDETIPGGDVTFRMVPVPGATFRMGSPDEIGRAHV